jgi:DNA-binding MarR family transcriptional regulator
VLTVDAVAACGERADGPTVGDVARLLGLDHSGASRMVAAAAERGYLARDRGAADARRVVLRPTVAGRDLIESSRRWQQATFEELTASWADEDRARFAGYLQRLAEQVGA